MNFNLNDDRPIFLQIAEGIEDGILTGGFPEESQIPSITEFSVLYKINPATALKGINLLVDTGILYKKRGIGMFVAAGAVAAVRRNRQQQFYESYILPLIREAVNLNLTKIEIISMIEKGFSNE